MQAHQLLLRPPFLTMTIHMMEQYSPSSSSHSSPPCRSAASAAGSTKCGEAGPRLPAVARVWAAGEGGSLRTALLLRLALLGAACNPAKPLAAAAAEAEAAADAAGLAWPAWLACACGDPGALLLLPLACPSCASLMRRECMKDAARHTEQPAPHTVLPCLRSARPTSPSMYRIRAG